MIRLICLFISGVVFSNVYAFDQLYFEIEQVEFSGFQIENFNLIFDVSSNDLEEKIPQLSITISKLKSASRETFKDIRVECLFPSFNKVLQFNLIDCQSGSFSAKHNQLGWIRGAISFFYDRENDRFNTSINQLKIAKGLLTINAIIRKEKWRIILKGQSLDVAMLKKLAATFISLPEGFSDESGKISFDIIMEGRANKQISEIRSAKIKLSTDKLSFNGDSVAEELDANLNVSVKKQGVEWRIKEDLSLLGGAIYLETGLQIGSVSPGFLLEPGSKPITVTLDADMHEDRVNIHKMVLNHPQLMTTKVSGVMHLKEDSPIDNFSVSLKMKDLSKVFPVYLQPLLFGSGLDEMEIVGEADLDLKLGKSGITDFHLKLGEVYAEDNAGKFHIAGLDGDIRLNSDPNVKDSGMKWRGGSIYKMNIGASEVNLSSKGRSMRLREKVVIPIFDGELQIHDLELKNLGLENYSVRIESKLTPVTLSEFTEVLSMPIMAGNISGEIPGVTFYKGNLTTQGQLKVNVFDGDITISKLRIEDFFDLVPTLYSDIDLHNLDLGILTKTFEFGNITGKLGGYMHDVRLDNWQPVKFDARFATPEDDTSRHRISQRAIDNLTSIGGGGGANAVSRGILGMFEDFPYSKIGLSCRLVDAICFMDGVEKSDDGYFIVKRGLLPPWLNIKGFNHEVNWPDLLERLKNISKTESPVIE